MEQGPWGALRRFEIFTLVLTACLAVGLPQLSYADPVTLAPVKAVKDGREYRYLELPNRLAVLLISDPDTDKSAAAVDIRVGSRHDPDNRLGLSHFLEHMLFLGTERFPDPGEYQRFIQAHGGSHNASTSYEHTNYFFDIKNSHFEGALERFAQFFIAPIFAKSLVDRERHAVHAEYQARLTSDGSRTWDAIKQVFNPDHPASRFTVGNLETLSNKRARKLRDDLLRFWLKEYSANRMTLVLHGANSLDQLQVWAESLFGLIENRELPVSEDRIEVPMFAAGRLPALLEVEPTRDIRELALFFPVSSTRPHFRAKPVAYLSHILGHEGEGSLLSKLKETGWTDGLSAGLTFNTQDSALFRVHLRLTAEGVEHVPDIIGYLFQTVNGLRAEGLPRWRSDEQARILSLAFEYKEPSSPLDYTVHLARGMHFYPPSEILRGPYVLDEYNPDLVMDYLGAIRPDNMLIVLTNQAGRAEKRSPYFNAGYRMGPVSAGWLARWSEWEDDEKIHMPAPNVFLPKDTVLSAPSSQSDRPSKLIAIDGLRVFHHEDVSFAVPKANVYVSVRSPMANNTARNRLMTQLYLRLVREQLREFAYPASIAGLHYQLYAHSRGFTLRVSGYNDKLDLLMGKLLSSLRTLKTNSAYFAAESDDLRRSIENRAKDQSFRIAARQLTRLLLEPSWTERELLEGMRTIDLDAVLSFVPELFASLDVVMLIHGNIKRVNALSMASNVRRILVEPAEAVKVPRVSVVRLERGERYRGKVDAQHSDSGICLYYQGRSRSVDERARMALLIQLVSAPFYLELRTRQQLGYVVFANDASMLEVPGLSFVVQSPGTPAPELEAIIRFFLESFAKNLKTMTKDTFEMHKAGVLARILEVEKTLSERTERYWEEIDRRQYTFDSRMRLADAVRKVEQKSFLGFVSKVLAGAERREISSLAIGANHIDSEVLGAEKIVVSSKSFRNSKTFYRSP